MKPKTKLPRARVIHRPIGNDLTPFLDVRCESAKSARQRAKWENLSEAQKLKQLSDEIMWADENTPDALARACLAVVEGRAKDSDS